MQKATSKILKASSELPKAFYFVAGVTRLELATSCVTGKRSNQTELHPRNPHFLVGDAGLEPATSTL